MCSGGQTWRAVISFSQKTSNLTEK